MTNALRENAIRETRTKSRLPKDQTKADLAAACEAERAAMRGALCAQLPLPSQGQVARRAGTVDAASSTAVMAVTKRPRLGDALPPTLLPLPPSPVADTTHRALATRLLGALEWLAQEGHPQLGGFLLADDATELGRDGWDAEICLLVVGGLRQLESVLRARREGAWRLVRRGGALCKLGADRRRTGPLGADRDAETSWMSGGISAPLQLEPVAAGAPRRLATGCGSPRHECLAQMREGQIKTAFAHCVAKGRRRTRHASGLQVPAPLLHIARI